MSDRRNISRSRAALMHDLRRAQDCIDRKEFDEALSIALAVRAEAKAITGRDSAFAAFLAAVAADMGGDPEVALQYINEALAEDSVALPFAHSFEIIVARLRGLMTEPARDAADPTIERVYRLLLNVGKADNDCHMRLVEHYMATDRLDHAYKLVDALVELAPTCAGGWALRMTIARRLGREDIARESDAGRRRAAGLPQLRANMPKADA